MNTKKQRQKDLCHCFITSALKFVAITEQKIVILKKVEKKKQYYAKGTGLCMCMSMWPAAWRLYLWSLTLCVMDVGDECRIRWPDAMATGSTYSTRVTLRSSPK